MRSVSRDRRLAAAALAGLILFVAVFQFVRARKPKPDLDPLPSAPGAGLTPPKPSAQPSAGRPMGQDPAYTNGELQKILQKETDTMGIDRIVGRQEEELPESFLGDRIGRPETRQQAEQVIRRLSAMRQGIEANRAPVVPLKGETVPVLGKTQAGGNALEGPPEGQAAAPQESPAVVAGEDGSWSGSFGPGEEGQYVIRDEASWKQLWPSLSKDPVPEVDFSKESVAVLFLGVRPTGGFALRVKDTKLGSTQLLIRWKESAPLPGKSPPEGRTAPFTLRRVPRTDLPVRFERAP